MKGNIAFMKSLTLSSAEIWDLRSSRSGVQNSLKTSEGGDRVYGVTDLKKKG